MTLFHRFAAGIRALIWKTRSERELDEELNAYLTAATEQKMRAGMTREGADRAARAEMGSIEAVKDQVRDVGWEATVESVWREVRHSVRALRRSPVFDSWFPRSSRWRRRATRSTPSGFRRRRGVGASRAA